MSLGTALIVVATLIAGLSIDRAAGQAAAADDPLAVEVARLVDQLDAPQLNEREAAERQLIALGPAALEHLPSEVGERSAEVEQRLSRVRGQLERQRAREAADGATVTLPAGPLRLSAALDALSRQSGNQLVDFRNEFGQQMVDFEIEVARERTTFWQALDAVLDAAEMTVYPYGAEGAVAVVGRGPARLPRTEGVSYSGAFRVEASEISARRDLRQRGPGTLQLQIELAWEPRLRPIAVELRLAGLEAIDDRGHAVEVVADQGVFESQLGTGASSTAFTIAMIPPPRGARQIAEMRGRFALMLPGRSEQFEFAELAAARDVVQRRAGVSVRLEQVRQTNEIWEVRLGLSLDEPHGALQSHRGWVFNNPAYLLSPEGERVDFDGFETTRQTETDVGMAFLFYLPEGIAGHRFVYETPAAIVTVPVAFELTDLDLP